LGVVILFYAGAQIFALWRQNNLEKIEGNFIINLKIYIKKFRKSCQIFKITNLGESFIFKKLNPYLGEEE
jgi:hypothetical protein